MTYFKRIPVDEALYEKIEGLTKGSVAKTDIERLRLIVHELEQLRKKTCMGASVEEIEDMIMRLKG